ncbi:hypothetical protein Trydic_g2362 [Trypoxylus dichotomus]
MVTMLLNPYLYFGGVFAVVISFEYEFLAKTHIQCDAPPDKVEYAELFCMARTQNLRSQTEGAYLKNYGRWQFYIIIQMFIGAILCRIHLKMYELSRQKKSTIGKRYILTVCGLTGIIVCWVLTYFSLGRYFNTFISRVLYHAIDRNPVRTPLDDVFPLNAECFVEPMKSNATYWTNCKLPLNETTPLYFITLFVVYVIGLLWVANLILELAYEKIMETKKDQCKYLISILDENAIMYFRQVKEEVFAEGKVSNEASDFFRVAIRALVQGNYLNMCHLARKKMSKRMSSWAIVIIRYRYAENSVQVDKNTAYVTTLLLLVHLRKSAQGSPDFR